MWNPAIILPDPTVCLNKIRSPPDDEIIQALPVPPLITYEEIRFAIKILNQNSALGLDGFTANFYSSFPSLILVLYQFLPSQISHFHSIPCSHQTQTQ